MKPTCPVCGVTAPVEARFCPACGRALLASLGPAAEARFGAPSAYTPQHLADRVLKYRSAIEGEHKRVTVLFCDVVGSTALAERLGAEAMHRLMSLFFEVALAEVHRYEGTVNQFLGDGFMALFGAPLAVEQHERQAALAALAVQRAVTERLHEESGPLALRMGLNTGSVVVGKIGDNLRMDYTAIGDVTNVGARLLALAVAGSIVLSAETWARAQAVALGERLGDLAVRGRDTGVEAYRLLGARPLPPGHNPIEDRRLSPFVARARELEMLVAALGEAERERRGTVIGLVGDAGLGKSRLLYEFYRGLAGRGVTYLEGHCVPFGAAIPYLPILEVLRGHGSIEDADTPETVAAKVRALLADVDLSPDESAPYLLHLLGLKESPALEDLAPETIRQRTVEILRQLIVRGSRPRPLVLVVEDLHWIDAASEEFLERVVESLPDHAILLIASYRAGYRPGWIGKAYASQVAIRPLNEADARAIVRSSLGDTRISDDVTALILSRGEGNPFFLEELTHSAARHEGRVTPDAIPGSLQGLLLARIDRLPDETKRLLQIAAVIGREFSPALAGAVRAGAALTAGDAALQAELRSLVRDEFIFERNRADGVTYVFKHALTRDAVYASLLEGRRRRYHGAVAAALEARHPDRLEALVEHLANHYLQGDDDDKAIQYAFRAAEKAQRRAANTEAITYFRAVLARLASLPDTEANRLGRIDAVLRQAEAQFALGQHADYLTTLESIGPVVDAAGDAERRATWLYWRGFLHMIVGSTPEVAIGHCREAAEIARREGLEEIGAYAETGLAQALVFAGNLAQAVAAGEHALAVFEARGNLRWGWRVLVQLSPAENARGNWERSLAHCRKAHEYGSRLGDVRQALAALARAASTQAQRGDHAEALRLVAAAEALTPPPYEAAALRAIRGYAQVKAGRPDEGARLLTEALTWFARVSMEFTRAQFGLWLVEALLLEGRPAQARDLIDTVRAAAIRLGYQLVEGVAARFAAELEAAADLDRAAGALARAAARLEELGAANEHARALAAQAVVAERRGDRTLAAACRARAEAIFAGCGTLDRSTTVTRILGS